MRADWRKTLSELPLEELEKARLFIDLLVLKIKKNDPEIERELGLSAEQKAAPKGKELRKHPRHQVNYPCQYWLVGTPANQKFTAHMMDISPGGCQVRLTRPLRVGEMLRLEIKTASHGVKQVLGRIVWVRSSPADLKAWLAGVQFVFDHPAKEG